MSENDKLLATATCDCDCEDNVQEEDKRMVWTNDDYNSFEVQMR